MYQVIYECITYLRIQDIEKQVRKEVDEAIAQAKVRNILS